MHIYSLLLKFGYVFPDGHIRCIECWGIYCTGIDLLRSLEMGNRNEERPRQESATDLVMSWGVGVGFVENGQ